MTEKRLKLSLFGLWLICVILLLNAIALHVFIPEVKSISHFFFKVLYAFFIVFGGFYGLLGALAFPFFYILDKLFNYLDQKDNQKAYEKIRQKLPNYFSEVTLKDSSRLGFYVSDDDITCTAMLTENGEIVCEIHVSAKHTIKNYEAFLAYFEFPVNDSKET